MFIHKTSLLASSVLAATLFFAGCASETASREETPDSPPVPVGSADGLAVEESTSHHVAGSFERGGTAVRFDLTRSPSGDSHHVVIARGSGDVLFESTLARGIDRTNVLEGRLMLTGAPGEEPYRDGDASAFEELAAMRETQLLPQLKEALEAAGIEPELFRPTSSLAGAGALAPKVYGAGGNTSYPDNVWRVLLQGQYVHFYSWGFWAKTFVSLQPVYGSGAATVLVRVGPSATEVMSGVGPQTYSREWWGAHVFVENRTARFCGLDGSCNNTSIWLLIR